MAELFKAKTPNLGFGNMRMPKKADGTPDAELIFRMVDTYLAHGYHYFDTAYSYPGSEEMLHKALVSRYPRERYHITTKVYLGECESREDMRRQMETSLARLGVDYVDMYFLHGLSGLPQLRGALPPGHRHHQIYPLCCGNAGQVKMWRKSRAVHSAAFSSLSKNTCGVL